MSGTDLATAAPASGIVWAFQFKPDGTAFPLLNEQVDAALAAKDGGWVWVHLGLADTRCRNWISRHAPISELARETLLGPEEHLRLDILGNEIVGVIPDLHLSFDQPDEELVRLRFVLTEHMLVSARRTPVHSVEINRRAIESGKRFPTAISLLDGIVDHFADSIAKMTHQIGEDLDKIGDQLIGEEPSDQRSRIGRMRLQAVRVHRQLAQLRSLFHRLEPRLESHSQSIAQPIRALAQKLDALDYEVQSLHERARLLIDEVAAKMTEVTNRRLYTLSVLTACLLPPTLVTGFFGMNTKDMPFQNTDGGTWLALAVAVMAAGVIYWALRRIGAL